MSLSKWYVAPSMGRNNDDLEMQLYRSRLEMEERAERDMRRPQSEREMYMNEIRTLEGKSRMERDANIKLSGEIRTLNERIKYLEEAILELEGDKNA